MKQRVIVSSLIVLAMVAWVEPSFARVVAAPVPMLLDHPVGHVGPRSQDLWRRSVGHWGENIADQSLRLRGYSDVREVKSGAQGIDRIGLRRNAAGEVTGVRIVEVKVHRGSNLARLGETSHGRQMSRAWLAQKFRQMRNSPDRETRQLARDISRFRRHHKVPVVHLGEIHEINTNTGRYTVRRPGTGEVLMTESIDRHLAHIGRRAQAPGARAWARRQQAYLPKLRDTRMSAWLAHEAIPAQPRGDIRSGATSPVRAARKYVLRMAGPLGATAALMHDMQSIHSDWGSYQSGKISQRAFVRSASGTAGGAAGAASGGISGGLVGIQLGSWGGPVAWITLPAGGLVGAGVGGVGGYFVGRYLASRLVDTWYGHMDRAVQEELEQWLIKTASGFEGYEFH